jgi:hypothetical protein
MISQSDTHLAKITPITTGGNRVMNRRALWCNAARLVAYQTLWVWFVVFAIATSRSYDAVWPSLSPVLLSVGFALLVSQIGSVLSYPEWPVNGWICRRLRRSISKRVDRPGWTSDSGTRVVELLPRENWQHSSLETATDLMLLHIDEEGVQMEGDVDRYVLTSESILDVQMEEIRPAGWAAPLHLVVIIARTDRGLVELPIAYRDFALGNLRPSRRREQTIALLDRIHQSAASGMNYPPTRSSSTGVSRLASENPYALT